MASVCDSQRFCIAPRNVRRYEFGIAVMNDVVFVCGGIATYEIFETLLQSCEHFSADRSGDGKWMLLTAQLPQGAYNLAMAVAGSKLYAIGGATWRGYGRGHTGCASSCSGFIAKSPLATRRTTQAGAATQPVYRSGSRHWPMCGHTMVAALTGLRRQTCRSHCNAILPLEQQIIPLS